MKSEKELFNEFLMEALKEDENSDDTGFFIEDKLKSIILVGKHKDKIPESISQFESVELISLGGSMGEIMTEFKTLPESISMMKNLKTLIIRNANISTIPQSYKNLLNLKDIEIINTNLFEVPDFFTNFTKLNNLELINNKIERVPHNLGKLTHLKVLNLSGNQIKDLPISICELSSLKELDLGDNLLNSFPDCITKLKSLKDFFFDLDKMNDKNQIFTIISRLPKIENYPGKRVK